VINILRIFFLAQAVLNIGTYKCLATFERVREGLRYYVCKNLHYENQVELVS